MEQELYFEVLPWSRRQSVKLSSFDIELRKRWEDCLSTGVFLHEVETEPSRIPGARGFVAALCRNRASMKRKSQSFSKIKQERNPNSFNFTKVKKNEILFCIETERVGSSANPEVLSGTESGSSSDAHAFNLFTSVIINNSPYEYSHCLLVPDLDRLLIQSITVDAIRMGIVVLLRSAHPGFRLMYNSLCGGASVNHLHLHCYYTEYWLHSEAFRMFPLHHDKSANDDDAERKIIFDDCFELDFSSSYVRGFGFIITKENYSSRLPWIIFQFVQYFNEHNIPHNIAIIRGILPSEKYLANEESNKRCVGNDKSDAVVENRNIPLIRNDSPAYMDSKLINGQLKSSLLVGRVYIFPRVPAYGEKSYTKFLVNVTELFGHLYFGDVDIFNSMTEDDIVKALNAVSLPEKEFATIKSDMIKRLSEAL